MKDTVVWNLSSETNNWMSKKTSSLMLLECISLESLIQDSLAGGLSPVLSSFSVMGCVFRCSSLGRAKPKWDACVFYLDLYRVFCACQIEPLLLCFVIYYFKVNVVNLVRSSAKFWQVKKEIRETQFHWRHRVRIAYSNLCLQHVLCQSARAFGEAYIYMCRERYL